MGTAPSVVSVYRMELVQNMLTYENSGSIRPKEPSFRL